jgi:hypothetical protein
VATELVLVTLIYDTTLGSPIEYVNDGGKQIAVPASQIPLPQRGVFVTWPGFSRQSIVGGVLRWEWVMQGAIDQLDAFVDSITGKGGWLVTASRNTMKTLCQALLRQGFTRAQIQAQVPQLYQAIAAELTAEAASP